MVGRRAISAAATTSAAFTVGDVTSAAAANSQAITPGFKHVVVGARICADLQRM